jgi:hypothetical protein
MRHRQCQWGASNRITERKTRRDAADLGSEVALKPASRRCSSRRGPVPKSWNLYDVTPDGQRFSVNIPLEWTSAASDYGGHELD